MRLTDCNLQSQLYCAVTHFQQNFSRFKICIRHIHNYTEYNHRVRTVMKNLEMSWNFKTAISRPGKVLEK